MARSCAELKALLAAAEAAQAAAAIGGAITSVHDGHKRVDYQPASAVDMARAIDTYRRQIAACEGGEYARHGIKVTPV